MPGPDTRPGSSRAVAGVERTQWVWILAVLLFLFLAGGGWRGGLGADAPAWLDQAHLLASDVNTRGVGFLQGLDPAGDPRVGPAALLMLLGLPGSWLPGVGSGL